MLRYLFNEFYNLILKYSTCKNRTIIKHYANSIGTKQNELI